MADNTDTTRPGETEAVDVREQAARDIEAEGRASPPFAWVGDSGWTAGLKEGYKRSAEIVRGGR